ncbi:MAG: single-stranded DNA-binding protein [Pseudonocardiaceae bacterium]
MNEITIHGNLTDEPTLRYSPSGTPILTCSVAVNGRRFNRATNRWVDKAPVFHQIVAFNALAENAASTLVKGATVTVTGEFVDDSWQPEEGRKIWRHKLLADDIAVSLRFATAEITKVRREQPAEPTEPTGSVRPAESAEVPAAQVTKARRKQPAAQPVG